MENKPLNNYFVKIAVERPQSNTTNIFKHYGLEHEPQIKILNWWLSLQFSWVGASSVVNCESWDQVSEYQPPVNLYQTATTTSDE